MTTQTSARTRRAVGGRGAKPTDTPPVPSAVPPPAATSGDGSSATATAGGARPYRKRRRAESEAETRQRIVEATMALHGALGPARTTIAAIAERAGVQRLTVYRHFPDERALFTACTSHYAALHPFPDTTAWAAIADPEARLRRALADVYVYHAATHTMMTLAARDLPQLPALADVLAPVAAAQARLPDLLLDGWPVTDAARPRLRAVIAHALALSTWRSLVGEQDLAAETAIDLMVALARFVADLTPNPLPYREGGLIMHGNATLATTPLG